jgi:hypothetical protein
MAAHPTLRAARFLALGFSFALGLGLGLDPSAAHAGDDEDQKESAASRPNERIDVVLPSVGLGFFAAPSVGYTRSIFAMSGELRWAYRDEHGGTMRVAYGTTVWGAGYGLDLDYTYRARLAGDLHTSLALDMMVGPTVAILEHNESLLPVGVHVGGNAGLSLDLRLRNFIVALGAQYRLLVGTEPALGGGRTGAEHVLTATLGVGFTLY